MEITPIVKASLVSLVAWPDDYRDVPGPFKPGVLASRRLIALHLDMMFEESIDPIGCGPRLRQRGEFLFKIQGFPERLQAAADIIL